MAKAMNTSVELALTLVRKAHTISLLAGLALALSGMSCESPTRLKLSQQAGSEIHRQAR
jgi:cytochrome b subunit of formate dehydrogenase